MEYRTLGKTGIKVSKLAFGGSSLGSVFRSVAEEDGIRTVHAALDHGINLIDTAPFYGLTKAETVLGKALKGVARERYMLATKVGRYGYKQEDFDFSAARVTASIDESLERIGCGHIDFIQIHDMEFGDINQIVRETLPALREAQRLGKVRFVGITCLPTRLFKEVMDQADVDQIQSYCHYALNDTALADILPDLMKKQVGVFNSAPLSMRLLTQEGPPEWHPAPAGVKAKCAEAAAYCAAHGADLAKLALQFSVAHPEIHTTIVGTANPDRILENIRQIEEPIDQALLAKVQEILKPIHNITWTSGRPENN